MRVHPITSKTSSPAFGESLTVVAATAIALALAAGLAGCGKSTPAASGSSGESAAALRPTTAARPAAAKPAADQGASAEEVARQARGDVSCPARVATPARAEKAPVDDVVGVRPGLTYAEAANIVECSNEMLVIADASNRGFNINTYGQKIRQGFDARFAEPHVVKTGKQIVQEMERNAMARGMNARREDLKPGQVKWFVGTMGLPGQERVLSAAREERFAEAQSPTVASVRSALVAKYGTPTFEQGGGGQAKNLRWAYDPLGRRITETSPLYARCNGAASPDSGIHLTRDCGVVVEATLIPQRANADLVERMQVGVVDQAGGDRLLSATEQGLQQMDGQRRAAEVAKAAKNAKAPSL